MLVIKSSGSAEPACTPNIVPCRIYHDGPTKITKRYWAPHKDPEGVHTSHFRGRRLRGRKVKLPDNYQGLILTKTEKVVAPSIPTKPISLYDEVDDIDARVEEDEEDLPEPAQILEKSATFDDFFVWEHDQIPAADDVFVRSIDEWISFAEALHGKPSADKLSGEDKSNDSKE